MKHIYDAALRALEAAEAVEAAANGVTPSDCMDECDCTCAWCQFKRESARAAPGLLALLREQVTEHYKEFDGWLAQGDDYSQYFSDYHAAQLTRIARAIADAYPQHSGELRKALEAQHD